MRGTFSFLKRGVKPGPVLGGAFLLGLWVYQLPVSSVERVMMKILRPMQKVMHTDRLYRMYAPDPRSSKQIPFLRVTDGAGHIRFLKNPPHQNLALLPFLSNEKWGNFLDHMAKAIQSGDFLYSEDEGRAMFRRLAERICEDDSTPGERAKEIDLGVRRVSYGEFRGDIVWEEPQVLESFTCR